MKRLFMLAAISLSALASGRGVPHVIIESRIVEVGPGILSANFGTNLGNLYANLPSDLAPGDRVSGTFATLPKGTKEAERARNAEALRSLTVEICGERFPVSLSVFTCPKVSDLDSIEVVLEAESKPLDHLLLSVPGGATYPGRASFVLPTEGLVFNRARIVGPFDGDLRGTLVKIGSTRATIVAESPRSCVFDVPKEPVGETRIEFRKGTAALSGVFRSVGLRLTPPRPIIHTGDSTSFAAEVIGLAGLERPLHLILKNLSTDIIVMDGGDEQSITIAPSEVTAAGTFAIARRLSGKRRGDYTVNVSIPWSQESFRNP